MPPNPTNDTWTQWRQSAPPTADSASQQAFLGTKVRERLGTKVKERRRFLSTTGAILQRISWIVIFASLILGILLAFTTRDGIYGTEHPFVVQGIALAIGGAAQGLVTLVLGTLAVYIASRDGVSAFQAEADRLGDC
jgi:hypothetical protein